METETRVTEPKTPEIPKPAATVVIAREATDGFEVFMVVRHQKIDFASGALVFPGGKVDDADTLPELRNRCQGAEGLTAAELGGRVAAIRETYEECGILLARFQGSTNILPGSQLSAFEHYRTQLNQNEITIGEFLETENLVLALDRLIPFAHWIGPKIAPKRFDTWFYLAEAPEDHIGIHDGTESVDSVWIKPAEALKECEAGKRTIIFPTRLNIMKLAQSRTLDECMDRAKTDRIVTVAPWVEERDSGAVLCIQADAGYEITEEFVSKLMGNATGSSPIGGTPT